MVLARPRNVDDALRHVLTHLIFAEQLFDNRTAKISNTVWGYSVHILRQPGEGGGGVS